MYKINQKFKIFVNNDQSLGKKVLSKTVLRTKLNYYIFNIFQICVKKLTGLELVWVNLELVLKLVLV